MMKSSARESKSDANALKKVADFFKSLLTKETNSATMNTVKGVRGKRITSKNKKSFKKPLTKKTTSDNIKSQSTEKENSINQKGLIL